MIIFSKFLATIKIDVPIKLDMKALVREEPNEEELRKIFEELNSVHSLTVYSRRVVPLPLLPLLPIFFTRPAFTSK